MTQKHMSMTLQKQILDRIKTQGVKPTPKGYFKLRDYLLWTVLGVFLAALSVGFGMIMFMIKNADLTLFEKLGFSTTEKIMYSIPFFWIIATVATLGIALIGFRNTKKGYKTSAKHFAVYAVLIAVALGSVAYALNIVKFIDRAASAKIPLYNAVVPLNTNAWFDPQHGLLSGVVKEKNSDRDFTLRDPNSVLWQVTGGIDMTMPSDFKFSPGDRVKLIGTAGENDTFRALEIIPWEVK